MLRTVIAKTAAVATIALAVLLPLNAGAATAATTAAQPAPVVVTANDLIWG
ncbi:hypothetical protein GCM10009665_80030 [Kitasatospora nipponensis]|uniref:Uncharacterized protein n=1 Tax=Kitasatospora nipponensis TaxID=258049 RepID=A0ABP4DYS3_9ACTN